MAVSAAFVWFAFGDVRLEGPFGARLDRMIANHLEATDAVRLASGESGRRNLPAGDPFHGLRLGR